MNPRRRIRHLTRLIKDHKWASTAMAVGVVVIAVAVIISAGGGDSGNSPTASPTATLPPASDTGTDDSRPPTDGPTPSTLGNLPGFSAGSSGTHAYAFSIGDTKIHTVTLTVVTDGKAYLGYQFRYGKPHKVLTGSSFSITKRLHGPSPIAQIAGQVVGGATYTTCSITIDGKRAITHTVHGLNNIAFCGS
jgi:hypothetical protein